MAKTPASNPKKKPRHTAAQKKAARLAREKQARAQLKGRPVNRRDGRRDERWDDRRNDRRESGRDSGAPRKERWRDRDEADPRGRGRWEDRGSSRGSGSRGPGAQEGRGYRPGAREDDRRSAPRQEHSFRAHREEREGRYAERGRHEGRSWDGNRRREDRWEDRRGGNRWEDNRQGKDSRGSDSRGAGSGGSGYRRGGERWEDRRGAMRWEDRRGPSGWPDDNAAELGEQERDEADAAYQQRQAVGPQLDATAQVEAGNGFADLGLHADLVTTLARLGITSPFPIQTATIPDALAGRDLLGRGQTGSGKTLAFGLPMLQRLASRPRAVPHRPRAIILSPTRELAMQSVDALAPLTKAMGKRYLLVAGGMSYTPQLRALDEGVDVLVATPGRLIDLIERSAADLSEVEVAVLDEADHMAQMGFVEAIRQILDLTPPDGQRMLFSATLDHGVADVAATYLTDPVTHSTDDVAASVTTMDHHVFLVHPHHKKPITAAIANRPGRTIVFCRTKLGADRVAMQLRESGVFAAALHGGLNQAQRTRVLDAFKAGTLPVLVATDVAARGIHVDDVSLVLQVDPPADHKDYLHRSGRTARAGEDGVVVTLALPHQKRQVKRLLDAAGVEVDPQEVAPEDVAVIETAGGSVPTAEPILQSQLDAILRPRRPQGRPRGGRPGGRYGDRNPRGGGPRGGRGQGGPRRDRGGYQGGSRSGGDSRPEWRPRG